MLGEWEKDAIVFLHSLIHFFPSLDVVIICSFFRILVISGLDTEISYLMRKVGGQTEYLFHGVVTQQDSSTPAML